YLRMLDQLDARPIPGTEGGLFATFSPDGQWIAYMAPGPPTQVRKTLIAGGSSLSLAEDVIGGPMTWGLDDKIYYAAGPSLLRVAASGGKPEILATLDPKKGEVAYADPQPLPGGNQILFLILTAKGINDLQTAVVDLKTHEKRVLLTDGGTFF